MTDTGTEVITYDSHILSASRAAGIDLMPLLRQVPEGDEDAYTGIMRQLLSAKSAAELNTPFSLEGMREYEGQPLVIESIRQMPSDFAEGLGVYLICNVRDPRTGEQSSISTGSVSVITQLIVAYVQGWLPLTVVPRFAKKPTAQGYTPMHLEVVAAK